METIITYRRRSVTPEEVATIRRIIETPPDKSRRFIAQAVGREWDWRQPKGVLSAGVCRSLLLLWEAKGFIKRPAGKFIFLPLIANNLRFLIRPGVQVSCWVSYPLALNRRSVSPAGQDLYDPPVQRLETLVATQRYRGTGYPADHWIYVGPTTGQGKLSQSRQPLLSKKAVQVYPLTENFRRELG